MDTIKSLTIVDETCCCDQFLIPIVYLFPIYLGLYVYLEMKSC